MKAEMICIGKIIRFFEEPNNQIQKTAVKGHCTDKNAFLPLLVVK